MSFILPLLGVFSLVFYSILGNIISQLNPSVWNKFTADGLAPYGFLLGLILTATSFLYLWKLGRGMAGYVSLYELSWADTRNSGGELRISYVNKNHKKREGLIVKRVEAFPTKPLTEIVGAGRYSHAEPIQGLGSSMTLKFEKSIFYLRLGFPSPEALNEVYAELKSFG